MRSIKIINSCFSLFNRTSKRKVDFIVAGAQKSGTSALYIHLNKHPEICMGSRKEIHFFDDEKEFQHGKANYSKYHSYYKPDKNHKILGEITSSYMYWHDSIKRIWLYNKKIKLVVILRNPIERAYSHWNMQHASGHDKLKFFDALKNEDQRGRVALPDQMKRYAYVGRGFYTEQIRRIRHYFPEDQTLIIKYDDLKQHPNSVFERLYEFLGVKLIHDQEIEEINPGVYKSPIQEEEREYLLDIFKYEIKGLEKMLGWDCSSWLT